jgi:TRAP-type uncharacterized transport system fused permease subunit
MGVPPLAAHLFVLYFGSLATITPPVALAAYAAASIAEAPAMKIGFTAWRLALPTFLIGYCLAFQPELLFIGQLSDTILVFIFCALGVLSMSIGFEGYVFSAISNPRRVLWVVAGVLLILPELITSLPGLALGLLLALTDRNILEKVKGLVSFR